MRKLLYLSVLLLSFAGSASAATITVTWTYVQGGDTATGFNVYRATDGYTYTKLTGSPLSIGTLTYADSTVVAGAYYYYVIKAVDGSSVESAQSNQIQALSPVITPVAPTNLGVIMLAKQ